MPDPLSRALPRLIVWPICKGCLGFAPVWLNAVRAACPPRKPSTTGSTLHAAMMEWSHE